MSIKRFKIWMTNNGLNPCYRGKCPMRAELEMEKNLDRARLNPCYRGKCPMRLTYRVWQQSTEWQS